MVLLRQIQKIDDVVEWDLCAGCGSCAYVCPKGAIELTNVLSTGIRPRMVGESRNEGEFLSICPGVAVDALKPDRRSMSAADREIGPTIEIWTGFASDPQIRFSGASGGVLTALSLFCVEREGMEFVLHTGKDAARPWLNTTVQSKSREELLARAGSRYAPSSPCDSLRLVEESTAPCVFVGKPCDAATVGALRKERARLDRSLGLVLTFFCAGTPGTQGTLDLAGTFPETERVTDLRYRGEGWPGNFKVTWDGGKKQKCLPYAESWSKLTSYRPLRCKLCPDGLGQLADISCGDAWHMYDPAHASPGISIVLVRTTRGQEILRRAIEAGYVDLQPARPDEVLAAQENLLGRRRELFGRLLALRLLGIPVPRFSGFNLFHSWMKLPFSRKLRTVVGTLRRALVRGWWRRRHRPVQGNSSSSGTGASQKPSVLTN